MKFLLLAIIGLTFVSNVHNFRTIVIGGPGFPLELRMPQSGFSSGYSSSGYSMSSSSSSSSSSGADLSQIEREGGSASEPDTEVVKPSVVTGSGNPVFTSMPTPDDFFNRPFSIPSLSDIFGRPAFSQNPFGFNPFGQNPFNLRPFGSCGGLCRRPWWSGPNVCATTKVIEESQRNPSRDGSMDINVSSKQCHTSGDSYICKTTILTATENKTSITTYSCCPGYALNLKKGSCVFDDSKTVNETLRSLGCSRFAEMFAEALASGKITDSNITIFAPKDESFVDFEGSSNKDMNEIPVLTDSDTKQVESLGSDMLTSHIVSGMYKLHNMQDGAMIQAIDNETTLRIGVSGSSFAPLVHTVNCVPIVTSDVRAKGTVIQIVEDVIRSPVKSTFELLSADPRFSIFLELVAKAGLEEKLTGIDNAYTILAPTNKAFEKLGEGVLEAYRKGSGCVDSILKAHMIESVVCGASIVTSTAHQNLLGEEVPFSRVEGKFFVKDVPVIEAETLTTNGIVFPVETLMVPEVAKPLLEVLPRSSVSDFLDFVNETGLSAKFSDFSGTLFVPMNPFNGSGIDPEHFFGHHSLPNPITDYYNNKIVTAKDGSSVRLNRHTPYPQFPGLLSAAFAQCSPIVKGPIMACGSVGYIITRPMPESTADVMKTISEDSNLSIFAGLLADSGVKVKLGESGPFTVLAPSDEALNENLGGKGLEKLQKDADARELFLLRHVVPSNLCCAAIGLSSANRALDDSVVVGRAETGPVGDSHQHIKLTSRESQITSSVVKCDTVATNGVVHTINRPLSYV